jgi:predicted metalloendopeptidase
MKTAIVRHCLAAALSGLSLAPATQAALDVAGLSPDIDPCTDFYQYANRRWIETTAIPDDRSIWGTTAILAERNEQLLREILEGALEGPRPAAGTPRRKVLAFYASGLDREAIARAGLAPLEKRLAAIARVADTAGLSTALAALQAEGIGAGFAFYVRQDAKDSTRYLAEVAQGGLGLPDRDYYFKDDERSRQQREAYGKHLARMFEMAGDAPAAASRNAADVLALETELARASMTAVERRDVDKTYNKMTPAQLAQEAPGFPWIAHFEALGARNLAELNVAQPEFFKAFAKLAHERPAAQWRAYLRWHLLRDTASKLPAAFEDADFAFYEGLLKGVKAPPSRHRHVLRVISGQYGHEPMAHALGMLFVERAFTPEAKARADALIANIKAALEDRLRQVDWMGEDTRRRALGKLAAINVKIGYPEKWRDFSDADVGDYPFVENWLRAAAYEHRRELARLGRPIDRGEWWMSPHMVNAYYNPRLNEIVFPAGILQPPLFDAKADDALNYGGIGMVIGHEITHGFDDRGRRYDARGNLRDWWTPDDERRYLERAKLVEAQFNAYEGVEGMKVNGKLTLGENISDLGGLKMAYLALQKALSGKPRDAIQGFTPDQRFFLSYAQIWRSRYRPEQERLLLLTNSHSPPRFRVQGPLANMPEFARAFACDPAKALRAERERVNIW